MSSLKQDHNDIGRSPKSTGSRSELSQEQQGRKCARCAAPLGRFYNSGAPCPRCKLRVCRYCRQLRSSASDWLCSLCNQLVAVTSSQDPRSANECKRQSIVGKNSCSSALDILKYGIRRAWTINGPPARWSTARKSAELRAYRSLPSRRRDYSEKENVKNQPWRPQAELVIRSKIKLSSPANSSPVKSSIPVYRSLASPASNCVNSRELDEPRPTHDSNKRSFIPHQRYRGSAEDLRRSREDISNQSFIPKLLTPRNGNKELKRHDDGKSEGKTLRAAKSLQHLNSNASISIEASVTKPTTFLCNTPNRKEPTSLLPPSDIWRNNAAKEFASSACKVSRETRVEEVSMVTSTEDKQRANDDTKPLRILDCSQADVEVSADKVLDPLLADAADKTINASDSQQTNKKIDEQPVIRRKFSKEELSTEETDDISNRRCSSHLSPEASPLSTRSSKYSPRESESEPTPGLPRKTLSEASIASQRIRDAISRTRRESNSSAKYESSSSEGVRLGDSGISSYVDIARRVKLFGSSNFGGASGGSCDEVPQRDSATSAGEDDHDDQSRLGLVSQNRVFLRRRRQFDAQGANRRRGRSSVGGPSRSCCYVATAAQELRPQVSEEEAAVAGLLDYRRLVFISSDSSSGREEDDADSSCSAASSTYLTGGTTGHRTASCSGIDDCDWDYFESNSLKLPPLSPSHGAGANDWSCCPASQPNSSTASSGCCQACGGLKNAKVLPVPVPIPVPVPYPVPVPASLWQSEFDGDRHTTTRAAAAASMIGRDVAHLDHSLGLRGCEQSAGSWFSWNPRFDSSPSSLLFSRNSIFAGDLTVPSEASFVAPLSEKSEEKFEPETNGSDKASPEVKEVRIQENQSKPEAEARDPPEMQRTLQELDSRSSSGRSSADSSDLDDSSSHRFSRVLVVNDDSLTSDNEIEDNEDSDTGHHVALNQIEFCENNEKIVQEPVVMLRKIRHLDEDSLFTDNELQNQRQEDPGEEIGKTISELNKSECDEEKQRDSDFSSYNEIYLASNPDDADEMVLLKSVRPVDPDPIDTAINSAAAYDIFSVLSKPGSQTILNYDGQAETEDKKADTTFEKDDDADDSAMMPDSLEVSIQDLDDSIEIGDSEVLTTSSPVEGRKMSELQVQAVEEQRKELSTSQPMVGERGGASPTPRDSSPQESVPGVESRGSCAQEPNENARGALRGLTSAEQLEGPMAKSRKKWQIPASFDIKGLPSSHFIATPASHQVECNGSSLLNATDIAETSSTVDDANAKELSDIDSVPESVYVDEDDDKEYIVITGVALEDAESGLNAGIRPPPSVENLDPVPESINGNKYKSLVVISENEFQPVNVITSDTTTLLASDQADRYASGSEGAARKDNRKKPIPSKRSLPSGKSGLDETLPIHNASQPAAASHNLFLSQEENERDADDDGNFTQQELQQQRPGPLILEEGLADDDSWVEEISHDEEDVQSGTTATDQESSEDEAANNLGDREEELRGYHRQAIDFTLHTIVEESCEESEPEHISACWRRGALVSRSAPELDSLSETSSILSEGMDSLTREDVGGQPSLAAPDKSIEYFLGDPMGVAQDRRDSDGSVGSDSEGGPSPEAQRRKKLVRARGTGRSHSSSLDNLLALAQGGGSHQSSLQDPSSVTAEGIDSQSEGSSTETDGAEETSSSLVKQKKKPPHRGHGSHSPRVADSSRSPEPRVTSPVIYTPSSNRTEVEVSDIVGAATHESEEDGVKTPQPESPQLTNEQDETRVRQQSRDSGFVGSCDDLLLSPQQRNIASSSSGSNETSSPVLDGARDGPVAEDVSVKSPKPARSELHERILESQRLRERLIKIEQNSPAHVSGLARKDSFNNWSSDEETNLMMSKMRQFFKSMVANSGVTCPAQGSAASNAASPAPSPSPQLSSSRRQDGRYGQQNANRTKPPQLVYFENELTRLMKTVPGIRDEQVREIVEYLSSEDTWSDSYDSSDYTSSDLEQGAAANGRRSALREQISRSCQQIIDKFDGADRREVCPTLKQNTTTQQQQPTNQELLQPAIQQQQGRDTALVYQKLVQSFTKMTGEGGIAGSESISGNIPHSSPPLIAKVMHHIGSRLVALMHEVSESNSTAGGAQTHGPPWRRYPHHRTPSSASTTEDDDSTSDSTSVPTLPRSKSHDPLLLINGQASSIASMPPETEEREASDYERFSWRGSFESALMAADSRTKLSLLACSSGGDVSNSSAASSAASIMAAKRRSAGDLLFSPKSFSREQLDRVRSCGSIGGGSGGGSGAGGTAGRNSPCAGSVEDRIWSNRRRSSVPDANIRPDSGASAGDDDTEEETEELECQSGDPRATTLPRGLQTTLSSGANTTNSLPRSGTSAASGTQTCKNAASGSYHFLQQHAAVKSARYRPPGFSRGLSPASGPKRAFSAPGLQVQNSSARSRRQQTLGSPASASSSANVSVSAASISDEASSLSEACSTPIIGSSSRNSSGLHHTSMDLSEEMDRSFNGSHICTTRASLSSLGARSDSMASVYSGAGEGRWCGSVAVRGQVEFSLQYDYKQLTFEVHVTQCRDLAPVDVKRNRSDPYVKVYLLPDKSKSGKRKTKVKKHTLNPVFDETLKFHTSINSLESRTLWLTVWHSDMFGRNDFLGEVRVPLENKIFDDPRPQWYSLQERTEPFDDPVTYKGEVIVGLKFVPPDPSKLERERDSNEILSKFKKNWSKGSLHVLVKEARNLQTRAKNSGTCDPFCKSYLLPDKGRSGKQKTGVVRRSSGSPVWNHTIIYKDVSLQELAERGLELTVWDHDRIASNEFLGGVRFNLGTGKHYGKAVDWMDATGREMSLWQSMLERPNFWVEGAVTLRPNLHNHGKVGSL